MTMWTIVLARSEREIFQLHVTAATEERAISRAKNRVATRYQHDPDDYGVMAVYTGYRELF